MNISKENLQFLKKLSENNYREWFDQHKEEFREYQHEFKRFHASIRTLMDQHDNIGSDKVFRIYRDVRFSKDKTPYKTNWSGSFKRATPLLRGGYYYQVSPDKAIVMGGFFGPNSEDLLHIRKQISQDAGPLREVLSGKSFKHYFGALHGEKVKTKPKGFSIDDPNIYLLRHKQFLVSRQFSKGDILSKDFDIQINETFRAMRPYFDVMSMYLTTDLNGEELRFPGI